MVQTTNSDIIIYCQKLLNKSMEQHQAESNQRFKTVGEPIFQLFETPHNIPKAQEKILAQQYVNILNENISEKINWDHQLLLLSGQQNYQSLNIQTFVPFQEFRNLNIESQNVLIQNQNAIKEVSLSEIKTPQIPQFSCPVNLNSFMLQEKNQSLSSQIQTKGCSCKKSQCLKMYCQCFRDGKNCEGCQCCDCKNTNQNSEQREKAIEMILEKHPNAFENKEKYKGCHCRKSQCSKNYCECYVNGLKCGKYCKCLQCENGKKNRVLKGRKGQNYRRERKKKYSIDI